MDDFEPRIAAFVCNWCTYTGADLAGTSRLRMSSNVRIIRLPCTGRIDPLFIIKAFERGADGVIVSGCHPADCHYTSGNYHARRRFTLFRELASFLGIDPSRMTFSWVSASEGAKWRDVVDETVARVRAVGPFTEYRRLLAMPSLHGESYATVEGLFGESPPRREEPGGREEPGAEERRAARPGPATTRSAVPARAAGEEYPEPAPVATVADAEARR
jgi:coenzyme F420-reducing hydrogenase delta subunit